MIPSMVSSPLRNLESPPGTSVTASGVAVNASPTPGTAGSGTLITITGGAQVAVNGATIGTTANVAALYYIGSTCFQQNASNSWYGPVIAGNGGGGPLSPPQPTVALSNATAASGVAGTTVGTMSTTTGAGSYAWAYSLSGTDAGSFQITGSTLQTSAALSTGTYGPVTITATNNAIYGSPFSFLTAPISVGPTTGFQISTAVATPTGNLINVNLTSQTGKTVLPALFGVSMSTTSLTYNATYKTNAWVSTMATINMAHVRMHMEGVLNSMFSTYQSTSPNYAVLAPLISGFHNAFPNIKSIEITVGWMATYFTSFNMTIASTADCNMLAAQVKVLAQYLIANNIPGAGIPVYWNLFNEPDNAGIGSDGLGTGGVAASVCASASAACWTAIASLSSSYSFGNSPTADGAGGQGVQPPNTGTFQNWFSTQLAAYPNTSFIAGHWYAGSSDVGTNIDLIMGFSSTGNSGWGATALYEIIGNQTYNSIVYPAHLNEYGFSSQANAANNHTIVGALFCSTLHTNAAIGGYFAETALWDGAQAGYGWPASIDYSVNGAIGTPAPWCFYLGYAGQIMPGNVTVANTTAPTGQTGDIVVLATDHGVMVSNYSQANAHTGAVAIAGMQNTSLHKWTISSAAPSGSGSVIAASALSSQQFNPLTITIYSP